MAYAKGSTSAAESAINVVKGALRQLCLTHTATWPELLPTLLPAINSQGLYGSSTSRAQLYFSPYSWQNSIKLNKLLFPEALFSETHDKLQFIIKKRQKNLTKRHIKDRTEYQPGNLVFAINVPNSKTEDGSSELAQTVQDLYYYNKVFPRYLRLTGVLTGVMRNLPRELCQKVGIHQLAEMQFQIKSHQMQRLRDSMLKSNQYLGPDHSRTWEYLMCQGRDTELPFEQSNQPDYNQSDPPVDDLSQPSRKTRSGRLYATTSYVLPKPILSYPTPDKGCQTNAPDLAQVQASARARNSCKLRGLTSFSSHLGIVSGATSSKQHVPTKIKKSISWDQELTIRL
jgi:hypothetical protein